MRRFWSVTFLLLSACYTQDLEVADGGFPCFSAADCGGTLSCCAGACLASCEGTTNASTGTTTGTHGTGGTSSSTSSTTNGTTGGTNNGVTTAGTTSGTTSSGTTSGGLTLEIRPNPGAFGPIGEGSQSSQMAFTVENLGATETGDIHITITGTNAADFIEGVNGCEGFPLDPSSTCSVYVAFWPSTMGSETATLTASASPGGQATAALTGTGF